MPKLLRARQLRDTYRFGGFLPAPSVRGVFGAPKVRVLTLCRRQKKQRVEYVADGTPAFMTKGFDVCETCLVESTASTWNCLRAAWTVATASK